MLVDSSSMFQNSNAVSVNSYIHSNNLLQDDDDSSVDSDASNNLYATGFNSLNSSGFGVSPAGLNSSAFDFPEDRKSVGGGSSKKKGVRKAVNLSGVDLIFDFALFC
jgi:hypothetical protein